MLYQLRNTFWWDNFLNDITSVCIIPWCIGDSVEWVLQTLVHCVVCKINWDRKCCVCTIFRLEKRTSNLTRHWIISLDNIVSLRSKSKFIWAFIFLHEVIIFSMEPTSTDHFCHKISHSYYRQNSVHTLYKRNTQESSNSWIDNKHAIFSMNLRKI